MYQLYESAENIGIWRLAKNIYISNHDNSVKIVCKRSTKIKYIGLPVGISRYLLQYWLSEYKLKFISVNESTDKFCYRLVLEPMTIVR